MEENCKIVMYDMNFIFQNVTVLANLYIHIKMGFADLGEMRSDGIVVFFVYPEVIQENGVYGVLEQSFDGFGIFNNPFSESLYIITTATKASANFDSEESLLVRQVGPDLYNSDFDLEIITNQTDMTVVATNSATGMSFSDTVPLSALPEISASKPMKLGVAARTYQDHQDQTYVSSIDTYFTGDAVTTTTLMPTTTVAPTTVITATPSTTTLALTTRSSSRTVAELFPSEMPPEQPKEPLTAENVLKQCDYFSPTYAAPPNNDKPLHIKTAFSLERVDWLSDVTETFSASGVFFLNWNVTTCPKDNGIYGNMFSELERMYVATHDEVWTPLIQFSSSSNDLFMKSILFGDDIVALQELKPDNDNRTLAFYWTRSGLYTTVCPLDLKKFPFDSQTCVFSFAFQRSEDLAIFWSPETFCSLEEVGVWKISNCSTTLGRKRLNSNGNWVSTVSFKIELDRQPIYYITNYVLPALALCILTLFSFVLPPDVSRPTFSVTILLAITVAQSEVTKDVPKTSEQILLPLYLLLLTLFSVFCCLYQMFICGLAWYKPKWAENRKALKCFTIIGLIDLVAFILSICFLGGINAFAIATIYG